MGLHMRQSVQSMHVAACEATHRQEQLKQARHASHVAKGRMRCTCAHWHQLEQLRQASQAGSGQVTTANAWHSNETLMPSSFAAT